MLGHSGVKLVFDRTAFEQSGQSVLTTVGGIYLAQPAGLHRLDRLVNRDLPSSSVYFETGEDVILPALKPFLTDIAQTMQSDDALRLLIEGHADTRGEAQQNQDLAKRRADNVAQFIIDSGVDGLRVNTVSFGEKRPLRKENTGRRTRNRRVELS